ncbi:MAG: glycosyltransferase family 9 protein [Nitrospirota bacterium]
MIWKISEQKKKDDLLNAIKRGEVRRILMLRCQKVGDMLTFLPVILGVRRCFPEAAITLVCREEGLEVAGRIPFVDIVVLDDIKKKIPDSAAPYDLLIASSQDAGRIKFRKELNIKFAVGVLPESFKGICFKHRWQYRYFTSEYRYKLDEHEVERNMNLLRLLGCEAIDRSERTLWITDLERQNVLSMISNSAGPLVIISPSGSKESKNWPSDNFASICDRLVKERGARIVIAGKGDLAEKQSNAMLEKMKEHALSIVNKTSLGEFAALVEIADLLISVDSGTAHVASYLNRPLLVLFGPGDYEKWKPWHYDTSRGTAINVFCECGTTNDRCLAKEHCLNSIRTEDVFREALNLLDSGKGKGSL